jgi:hypothetical protein
VAAAIEAAAAVEATKKEETERMEKEKLDKQKEEEAKLILGGLEWEQHRKSMLDDGYSEYINENYRFFYKTGR